MSAQRRNSILIKLQNAEGPIKGMDLANFFNVTRQIIVQDIALLRAQGGNIISTPQGYIIPFTKENRLVKRIVCRHEGHEAIEKELQIIIDHGGKIIDVIVEHPLYGEITSQLNISNKLDLDEFMKNFSEQKAEPLASLTDGIHIHTIEIGNEKNFEDLKRVLNKIGYLIKD